MSDIFDRVVKVIVDNILITNLRIDFKIKKTLEKDPNKLELEIYNLNEKSRAQLQKSYVPVVVEAGFKNASEVIYAGSMRHLFHNHNGPDWVTKIECGDGEKEIRTSRIHKSFKPGATFVQVASDLLDAMKLNKGNALSVIQQVTARGGLTQFVNGVSVSGSAADKFDGLMESMGLKWSVQNGKVQVLKPDDVKLKTTGESIVLLNPKSGLIGSPVHGEKNFIKITSLLLPSMSPGRKLKVESQQLKGVFKAVNVEHQGSTHSKPFYTTIEALGV